MDLPPDLLARLSVLAPGAAFSVRQQGTYGFREASPLPEPVFPRGVPQMSEILIFESTSPRFALPLLHAGQAQKEVFVNEALARCDALLHSTVSGERPAPPETAETGECWLVAANATDAWSGHDAAIASFQGGNWIFVKPSRGLRVYDLSTGQERLFDGFWRKGSLPVEPLGGMTVDVQARAAIGELVSALQALGIVPSA
jgi:hypothetical protein